MKRLKVKFLDYSKVHYSGLEDVPLDTVFKAVEFLDSKGELLGVMIRGSNLVKAGGHASVFPAKEYYFSLGIGFAVADVEVV